MPWFTFNIQSTVSVTLLLVVSHTCLSKNHPSCILCNYATCCCIRYRPAGCFYVLHIALGANAHYVFMYISNINRCSIPVTNFRPQVASQWLDFEYCTTRDNLTSLLTRNEIVWKNQKKNQNRSQYAFEVIRLLATCILVGSLWRSMATRWRLISDDLWWDLLTWYRERSEIRRWTNEDDETVTVSSTEW